MTRGRAPWPRRELPAGQLDTKAAAVLMGLAPPTLGGYRHRGVGPKYFKDPWGNVRYWATDVETWMREND